MRILVTGGTGFLGRALLPMLAGNEVFALTRKPRAPDPALPHVTWIEADLSAPFDPACLPTKMDGIIHLAQSDRYREFPAGAPDVFRVNVEFPAILMQWALKAGVSRAVFASTGTVYEPFTGSMREDAAVSPTGFYGASKLAAEALTLAYAKDIAVSQLRVFFLYGPGQQNMLISRLIGSVAAGTAVTLPEQGDGLVFVPTFVEDTARVFAQACLEGWRGVWNVASPHAVSMRTLVNEIGVALKRAPVVTQVAQAAPLPIVPDLTKLSGAVNVSAFLGIRQGLARTIGG